jgi:hypothetical protein
MIKYSLEIYFEKFKNVFRSK